MAILDIAGLLDLAAKAVNQDSVVFLDILELESLGILDFLDLVDIQDKTGNQDLVVILVYLVLVAIQVLAVFLGSVELLAIAEAV